MTIDAIDHLYVETNHWSESVAFWEGLGFAFAEQWGSEGHRAGRLTSNRASVVLAEVQGPPEATVFFAVDSVDTTPSADVEVVTPPADTHWGTRWTRVRDADGRVYALEEGEG